MWHPSHFQARGSSTAGNNEMDNSNSQCIRLAPMQQLAEALTKQDDWTGLTDAAARRKRQNRLNQRAYRRRKALEPQPAQYTCCQWQDTETDTGRLNPQGQHVLKVIIRTLGSSQPDIYPTPNGTTAFPLTADHLIPLIQLNVLRATLTNMSLLSILHEVPLECGTRLLPLHPAPSDLPASLVPTALQERTPHAHWIDVIPSATMRDNCIRLADTVDEDELCSDFVGGLYDGRADSDTKGWIVWNVPWDVSGWEVTDGFVAKWGRLLRGCQDVIDASNRWRTMRGEDPLVVEV